MMSLVVQLMHDVVCCSMLQCAAVCCSMLQCAAVCDSSCGAGDARRRCDAGGADGGALPALPTPPPPGIVMQHTATHCNALQRTAMHCNTPAIAAVPSLPFLHSALSWLACCASLHGVVCCSVLQCAVVCCSVLQCAVCCNVFPGLLYVVCMCSRTCLRVILCEVQHTATHSNTPHRHTTRQWRVCVCSRASNLGLLCVVCCSLWRVAVCVWCGYVLEYIFYAFYAWCECILV